MKRGYFSSLNTVLIIAMVISSLILVPAIASAEKKSDPVVLKVTSFLPPPTVCLGSAMLQWWEDEVSKRTDNQITFQNFWSGALASSSEHLEIAKNGTVQVAHTYEWYTPSKLPLGDFEYVFPFGPTDYEIVAKAMRQIRSEFPQFSSDLEKQNVVLISDPPGGTYVFLSKPALKTVSDFEGKKVGLVGRYFGRWLPPGATAVVRPGPQRYDLLRNGIIDVDLNPFDISYAFNLHEQTEYYVDVKPLTACWSPILMNKDTFESFSPETQKILLEAGKEMELVAAREIIPEWWTKIQKAWKDKGIETIDFPASEKENWAASLEDIPAEWAAEVEEKGYPGFEIVKRWQEITADLGFNWPRKWGVRK